MSQITPSTLSLYHYYELARGPFRNLSALQHEEAETILQGLRQEGQTFAARRSLEYLAIRRGLEERMRSLFIAKGGHPQRLFPHYMIVERCEWVCSWYKEPGVVAIPLQTFDPLAVSFTYGDSFPALRFQDGKPYRGQVYTVQEIAGLIERFGLPQDWNGDGAHGPERYIEAQIWDDAALQAFLLPANSEFVE